mmetsp:Transcript_4421/g.8900  ORF Transcript_4421/g.8900 Transcript_4421/m.8900 type:complete len:231 (-) Transcript_4421:358-1050(-)
MLNVLCVAGETRDGLASGFEGLTREILLELREDSLYSAAADNIVGGGIVDSQRGQQGEGPLEEGRRNAALLQDGDELLNRVPGNASEEFTSEASQLFVVRERVQDLEVNVNSSCLLDQANDLAVLGHLSEDLGGAGDSLGILWAVEVRIGYRAENLQKTLDSSILMDHAEALVRLSNFLQHPKAGVGNGGIVHIGLENIHNPPNEIGVDDLIEGLLVRHDGLNHVETIGN